MTDKSTPSAFHVIGNVLAWLFGILFFLLALISIPIHWLLSFLFGFLGLILLPPVRQKLSAFSGNRMSSGEFVGKRTATFAILGALVVPIGIAYVFTRGDTQPSPSTNQTTQVTDYEVIEERDISYAGCKRVGLVVTVPDETQQAELESTMQAIVEKYRSKWDDITVWASRHSERETAPISPYTLGTKEYSTCN